MTKATIAGGAVAAVLVLLTLALVARHRAPELDVEPAARTSGALPPATAATEAHQGFLYMYPDPLR